MRYLQRNAIPWHAAADHDRQIGPRSSHLERKNGPFGGLVEILPEPRPQTQAYSPPGVQFFQIYAVVSGAQPTMSLPSQTKGEVRNDR
jgi:hypothetical protein